MPSLVKQRNLSFSPRNGILLSKHIKNIDSGKMVSCQIYRTSRNCQSYSGGWTAISATWKSGFMINPGRTLIPRWFENWRLRIGAWIIKVWISTRPSPDKLNVTIVDRIQLKPGNTIRVLLASCHVKLNARCGVSFHSSLLTTSSPKFKKDCYQIRSPGQNCWWHRASKTEKSIIVWSTRHFHGSGSISDEDHLALPASIIGR